MIKRSINVLVEGATYLITQIKTRVPFLNKYSNVISFPDIIINGPGIKVEKVDIKAKVKKVSEVRVNPNMQLYIIKKERIS